MTVYRCWTTNLLTGQILADDIPLTISSMSRQIGGIGQLTGTLPLTSSKQTAVYLSALEPRRSVLWVAQDGIPVWNGIVWDWTHTTILDGTLPITASTMESLLQHRHIDVLMNFSLDIFETIRSLINFATSKTPNGQVAGLYLPSGMAGANWVVGYLPTDLAKVWDAITGICTATNTEISFAPGLDASGNVGTFVQLGYPRIGQPITQSQTSFVYPGNLLDYGFARTGSTSSNSLIATAPPNGAATSWQSQYPHGQDAVDLAAGYPLLEDTIAFSGVGGVTSQAQINGYADGKLPMHTGAQETPLVSIAPGQHPLLREISLGDYGWFTATSPLHPAGPGGTPGLQKLARIVGWTATPPGGGQTETVKIQLGGITLP